MASHPSFNFLTLLINFFTNYGYLSQIIQQIVFFIFLVEFHLVLYC